MENTTLAFDIKISDICSLNCTHCMVENNKESTDFKKIELEVHKIILCYLLEKNYLLVKPPAKCPTVSIHFSGGEPLMTNIEELYKFMVRLESFFHKFEFKFYMTTNLCYELTPARIRVLDLIDQLKVSFDSTTRFTSVKQLFQWYHNFKLIKTRRELFNSSPIIINTTLTKHNMSKMTKWKKFFDKLNTQYCFVPMMNSAYSSKYISEITENYEYYYKAINYSFHTQYEKDLLTFVRYLNQLYIEEKDYKDLTIPLISSRNFFSCFYKGEVYCIDNNGKSKTCHLKNNCKSYLQNHECCLNIPVSIDIENSIYDLVGDEFFKDTSKSMDLDTD